MAKRLLVVSLLITIVSSIIFYSFCGLHTIQPIGAFPKGITLVVLRGADQPFFNSPDAMCMKANNGQVNLLCRAMMIGATPVERVILKLPYMEWTYLMSTGGSTFNK
jgi:hypothetical protein